MFDYPTVVFGMSWMLLEKFPLLFLYHPPHPVAGKAIWTCCHQLPPFTPHLEEFILILVLIPILILILIVIIVYHHIHSYINIMGMLHRDLEHSVKVLRKVG